MKVVRNIILIVAAIVIAVSCAPQAFLMDVDMRGPSKSGFNLSGKSIAVAYLYNKHEGDSLFAYTIAEGFATRMEKEYFGGAKSVDIYKVKWTPETNFSSKKFMVDIAMDTGDDVVFLFDAMKTGELTAQPALRNINLNASSDSAYIYKCNLPFEIKLSVYDTMNKQDTVRVYEGQASHTFEVYTSDSCTREQFIQKSWASSYKNAARFGQASAKNFMSTWQTEQQVLMYYDDSEWYMASDAASSYNWVKAMDMWMKVLTSRNARERSCAEYNLAVACYVTGQYHLALKWLDASDKEYPIVYSSILRRRLEIKLK